MSVSHQSICVNNKTINEFKITNNEDNMVLTMVDYGATITSCLLGHPAEEVTLCYPLERLVKEPGPYFGATVGRVANRICKGKFELKEDGVVREYSLEVNNGENHLHGGVVGFDKKIWDFEVIDCDESVGVKFSCESSDMEEGYPGNVQVEAIYELSRFSNSLSITFHAKSDRITPINLTNHTYWNLSGNLANDILSHTLYLNCDEYLPVSSTQIPTGEYALVAGTPFDFRGKKPKTLSLPSPPRESNSVTSEHCPPVSTENNTETALTHEELANETDAEFIARMEREEAIAFAQAVENWRKERAQGGGQAVIVEAGGDFEGEDLIPIRVIGDSIPLVDGGGEPGLDHCFIINNYIHPHQELAGADVIDLNKRLRTAAVLHDPSSGKKLTCRTTQPGIQIYSSNWLSKQNHEAPYTQHSAICLETQGFPDAVNQQHFPSILLHPDNAYLHRTEYSFAISHS